MRAYPLAVIVIAQLFGTSLWFSANSAGDDLMRAWALQAADIGRLTIAVQLGFILGTLGFALSGLADRFAASRIFAVCAVLGAAANAGFALLAHGLGEGLAWRFVVGLALAGVYPLGMKLVVSWVPQHAGAALAWLVGMLTLGTALPHGVRALDVGFLNRPDVNMLFAQVDDTVATALENVLVAVGAQRVQVAAYAKGQHFAHLKAVEAYLRTGTNLPCDLTFLIEGEA